MTIMIWGDNNHMSRFIYRENAQSKRLARKKYLHNIISLTKAKALCKDRGKIARYQLKINSLKKTFHQKTYPSWFIDHSQAKLAVYTVLFGDYDTIKPVKNPGHGCDYYIVTDQSVDGRLGWKTINYLFPEELKDADNAIKNRYLKMHPEVLFPNYEYSLYLDGTMIPVCDLFPLLGRMGDHILGMYLHEGRDCIYEEAKTVTRIGKADPSQVDALTSRYRSEGFPEHFGMTTGGIILRKHHDETCKEVMEDWWRMFMSGPKRDQLSLMYCWWKKGLTMDDIAILGADYDLEPRLTSMAHK